jgi:Chaperone of endosialidase
MKPISKLFNRQSPLSHQFKTTKENTMKNNIKSFTISAIVASSLGVMAVSIPSSFTAGQPIKASDVNANFSSLKAAVDALEAAPQITVPFSLTGAGAGIGNATLQASNTNSGIAALISQSKTGASDAALVVIQSGTGPLLKGFGSNGGEDEIRVDSNGTLTLFKPDLTPNITLDNNVGKITAPYAMISKRLDVGGSLVIKGDPCCGQVFNALDSNGVGLVTMFQSGDLLAARNIGAGNDISAKTFTTVSDRNRKTNFASVNSLDVLTKVARLPIQRWNYKNDAANLRHIGPMAQDFHAAFGLNGADTKHISLVDGQGVALAAIQGLNQKLEQRNVKIKQLENKLATFEARLAALERK